MDNPTNALDAMLSRNKYQYPEIERPKIDLKMVKEFLHSGADLEAIEQRGTRCIPSVFWDVKLIKFFLNNGLTNLDARDKISGNTALIYAASHELKDSVKFLLEHSAHPNVRNFKGETALYRLVASTAATKNSSRSKRAAIAKMMIERGADVTAMTKEGLTLFHDEGFDPKIFGFLLNKLENPDVGTFKSGNTPLMEAARRGDVKLCRLLIKRNADVNAKNAEGYTPLHYAVFSDSFQCVKLLLSSGSNPDLKSNSGLDSYNMYRSIMLPFKTPLEKCSIVDAFQDPIRTVQALEMEGAWLNLNNAHTMGLGSYLWEKALEKRRVMNLPKPELAPRKKYAFKVQDYFRTEQELYNRTDINEVSRQALLILDLISNGSSWYLLRGISFLLSSGFQPDFELACEMLGYLDENADPKEMVETAGMMDEFNRDTIHCILIINQHVQTIPDNLLSFVSKICIWDFKNLSSRRNFTTKNMDMACHLCCILVGRRRDNDQEISETRRDLIKEIVNLGLRDGAKGNTLLHHALTTRYNNIFGRYPTVNLHFRLASVLISCGAEVTALNARGQEPIQLINPKDVITSGSEADCLFLNLVRTMVENGAHLDAVASGSSYYFPERDGNNYCFLESLMKKNGVNTVPYVSLKCLAARALTCSCVRYKGVIPEILTEFVNQHHY